MAEKKQMKQEEEKPIEAVETKDAASAKSSPPWPFITIGIFTTIVLLALMVAGWAALNAALQKSSSRTGIGYESADRRGIDERRMPDRMFGDGSVHGNMSMIAASGVITAINGDTLTVSGRGEQVTVKKTDETTIGGDKTSLAVNDTVIVIGDTEDDDSVTATRIIVRNESMNWRSFSDSRSVPSV